MRSFPTAKSSVPTWETKMLEVRSISAAYGQHPALKDVSLSVDDGEIVVILGANGAGKSTLLRAIAGICEGRVSGRSRRLVDPLRRGLPFRGSVQVRARRPQQLPGLPACPPLKQKVRKDLFFS